MMAGNEDAGGIESDFIGAVSQDEKSTIQGEIDQLMHDNPPGTAKYSDPKVQKRIRELSEQLHGTGEAALFAERDGMLRTEADGPAFEPESVDGETLQKTVEALRTAGGSRVLDEWGGTEPEIARNLAHAAHAVGHFRTTAPDLVEFLNSSDDSDKRPGDDPDFIWVAGEYGKALASRMDDWNSEVAPQPVAGEVVENAAIVLPSRLVQELGGADSEQFARSLAYAAAARDHLAGTAGGKRVLAKLMRPDPDNPDFHIGDQPAIARAAVEFGKMLIHGRRISGKTGKTAMTQKTEASADIDALIQQRLTASSRGDGIKAKKLQAQIDAHFSQYDGQPIIGQGGRNV